MAVWLKEEIDFLRDNLDLSPTEIWDLYKKRFNNRSYDSIQKKVRKLKEAFSRSDDTSNQSYLQNREIPSEVRAENEKGVREWLEDIAKLTKNKKFKVAKPVQSDASSLVIVLSDLHVGKSTEWFNLDVAKTRLLSMPRQIANGLPDHDIDEVVVALVGDLVEGEDIYPNQPWGVDAPAINQLKACSYGIWDMLVETSRMFDCPVRVVSVPGNHGRTSKTADGETNWDNAVLFCLSLMADGSDEDISICTNQNLFLRFQVKDKVGLLYHHGVKHTGTPAMREKVAGWKSGYGMDFLLHGHWHEWKIGTWIDVTIVSNGCLCGPDDLADKMAKPNTARQGYFLVTPGKPLSNFGFIEWNHINEHTPNG
jgi:predicted phosphodiesterase